MRADLAIRALILERLANQNQHEEVLMIEGNFYRLRIERVPTEQIPEVVDEYLNTTA